MSIWGQDRFLPLCLKVFPISYIQIWVKIHFLITFLALSLASLHCRNSILATTNLLDSLKNFTLQICRVSRQSESPVVTLIMSIKKWQAQVNFVFLLSCKLFQAFSLHITPAYQQSLSTVILICNLFSCKLFHIYIVFCIHIYIWHFRT